MQYMAILMNYQLLVSFEEYSRTHGVLARTLQTTVTPRIEKDSAVWGYLRREVIADLKELSASMGDKTVELNWQSAYLKLHGRVLADGSLFIIGKYNNANIVVIFEGERKSFQTLIANMEKYFVGITTHILSDYMSGHTEQSPPVANLNEEILSIDELLACFKKVDPAEPIFSLGTYYPSGASTTNFDRHYLYRPKDFTDKEHNLFISWFNASIWSCDNPTRRRRIEAATVYFNTMNTANYLLREAVYTVTPSTQQNISLRVDSRDHK